MIAQTAPAGGITVPEGWRHILQPGEVIHWQGRPRPTYLPQWPDLVRASIGLVAVGSSQFWLLGADQPNRLTAIAGTVFWIGLAQAAIALVWGHLDRRRQFYTLSDRHAFIARSLPVPSRRLESWPLEKMTDITLQDGRFGSVWFATRTLHSGEGKETRRIGFEGIAEARKVFGLLTELRDARLRQGDDMTTEGQ
ncbi:hypothetical protein [Paracoccus marinaquae]|uniref:DUF304 domain-containing protein n=1 Tax=Paracoccus marinaquae TaxID=2841926 RepID=A0ABS6ANM0_9RHOB|nr:hypothetical protein [Paracoccus marinaquae]MBU3031796.1 hypothetical protein [Paracoccus marinaquae]